MIRLSSRESRVVRMCACVRVYARMCCHCNHQLIYTIVSTVAPILTLAGCNVASSLWIIIVMIRLSRRESRLYVCVYLVSATDNRRVQLH